MSKLFHLIVDTRHRRMGIRYSVQWLSFDNYRPLGKKISNLLLVISGFYN